MPGKSLIIAFCMLTALILSGCATTQQDVAAPSLEDPATEVQDRVVQELEDLGEKELAREEREAAAQAKTGVTYDIPITINDEVNRFIKYFQTRIPERFKIWLARSGRYLPMMRGTLKQYGLPEDLVYLALIESGFSCQAYSRAHAVGPWQFIRGTGKRYGLRIDYWVDERRDPVKATHAAAKYLRDLYAEFKSWYLAAAAYNAGEAKIRRALSRYQAEDFWAISQNKRRYLKNETKNYVPKMIAAAIIAKDPTKYGFKNIEYHQPLAYDTVSVHAGTSLSVAAKLINIKSQSLVALNPELRRWCTPPNGGDYALRIPAGQKAAFDVAYAELRPNQRQARIGTIKVTIRSGDTLGRIARTYGISPQELLSLNGHLNPRRLQIGQTLMVPPGKGFAAQQAREEQAPPRQVAAHKPRAPRVVVSRGHARKLVHQVAKGDTIWDIAQSYGLNYRDIKRWNGRRGSRLKVGDKLVLYVSPSKAEAKLEKASAREFRTAQMGRLTYMVRKGDNLWTIGKRFNVSPRTLRRWNGLTSNRLNPGDRLTVRQDQGS